MVRANFESLVIPFRFLPYGHAALPYGEVEYAIFRRRDEGYWQSICGGGESGETPLQTAMREANEEGGIPADSRFFTLDTVVAYPMEPQEDYGAAAADSYVTKQHCFAVELPDHLIALSPEHTEYRWVGYDEAMRLLKWDSDKTALWELRERIRRGAIKPDRPLH